MCDIIYCSTLLISFFSFIGILMTPDLVKNNDDKKERILFLLAQIYNLILGFLGWVFLLFLAFSKNFIDFIFNAVMYGFILVPINKFVNKRIKLNSFLYIFISIVVYIIGVLCFFIIKPLKL